MLHLVKNVLDSAITSENKRLAPARVWTYEEVLEITSQEQYDPALQTALQRSLAH